MLLVASLAGCGHESDRHTAARPLPLRLLADSAASQTFALSAPSARAWLTRVSGTRSPAPPRVTPAPAPLDVPPPMADPDTLEPEVVSLATLEVDPGLKPPILRTPALLVLPRTRSRSGGSVDLDVRVDEAGDVSDALWADGAQDSALVNAAIESALAMKFHPALRAGRPVAVWCRERFDFASR